MAAFKGGLESATRTGIIYVPVSLGSSMRKLSSGAFSEIEQSEETKCCKGSFFLEKQLRFKKRKLRF